MTGGQLVYENNRLTLARPDTPVDRFIREYAGGFGKPNVTMEDITPDEPYPMHAGVIRAFADHILTGAPMIADGREGLCSLMLANAMLLSSWTDETIELPLDDALRRPSGRAGRPKPEKDREADQAGRQQIVLTAFLTTQSLSKSKFCTKRGRDARPLRVRRNLLPRWGNNLLKELPLRGELARRSRD